MQRLVNYQNPEGRETPLLLLGALREIDPTVELVYAGDARWWLGAMNDNSERRARAENMAKFLDEQDAVHRNQRTVLLTRLNLQGFGLIEAYHGPEPTGTMIVNPGPDEYATTILEDFRWRDANWRKDQGSEIVKERLLDTLGEPARIEADAKFKQYMANDGRSQYRRLMRGRTQFGHGGMTGGDRALIIPAR